MNLGENLYMIIRGSLNGNSLKKLCCSLESKARLIECLYKRNDDRPNELFIFCHEMSK